MTVASHDRVLVAAAEEFAAAGYDGATVRRIAERCAMSTGSLFHHYASKRELLVAVIAEGSARAHDYVAAALQSVEDPRERLARLVVAHLETIHGESRAFTLMASREFYLLDEEERRRVVVVRDRYEALWQSVLDEAAAAGLVSSDPLLRLFLLGAVNQTFLWFSPTSTLTIEQLGERFVALVALGGPEGAHPPRALAGASG